MFDRFTTMINERLDARNSAREIARRAVER